MNKIINKFISFFKKIEEPEGLEVVTNEDRLISYLEANKERFRIMFNYEPVKGIMNYVDVKYVPLGDDDEKTGKLSVVSTLREVKTYQKNEKRFKNPYKEGKVLSPEIKFYMDEIKKAEAKHEIQIRESLPDGITLEDTFKEIMDGIEKVKKNNK
jgi:hypothetical protein